MNSVYKDFNMLTAQTGLPPNQPTSLKVKNMHNFVIFQLIWLKLSMQSLNGRTRHMNSIYIDFNMLTGQTRLPPNQPTSLKVKNVHNFVIFQLIWLKLSIKPQNGRTHHRSQHRSQHLSSEPDLFFPRLFSPDYFYHPSPQSTSPLDSVLVLGLRVNLFRLCENGRGWSALSH